jgi:hypothetical protein
VSKFTDFTYSDLVISTLFFQFCLYVCVRLARRGFTLGELGIICHAGTGLFMEVVNLTRTKVRKEALSATDSRADSISIPTDFNLQYALRADVSITYSAAHFPARTHPGVVSLWVSAFATAGLVT